MQRLSNEDVLTDDSNNIQIIESLHQVDNEVEAEKELVERLVQDQDLIPRNYTYVINDLRKYYKELRAVGGISFALQKGDCFGLLGSNGAGKTSTFQMLTGESPISYGNAFVNGYSIKTDWKKAGRHIGYCPQFDALIEEMTGYETLCMYGRLRGIPERELKFVCNLLLEALGLTEFRSVKVKNYSGGSKRKLSLGVALIGEPDVLLLDEPTSGVDPKTRRFVWQVLNEIKTRGIAILLSSHSMEECEALCTRISIMSKGELRCIGTPQHLKSKFGTNYTIDIKAKDVNTIPVIDKTIKERFPSAVLQEQHTTVPPLLTFALPVKDSKWSELFGFIQRISEEDTNGVLDYSVAQTTLEQVFLNLTKFEDSNDP